MPSYYIIGAGSGLVSAALFGASAVGGNFAFILLYLAALPICLAGLGWGNRAGLTAVIAAVVILVLAFGPLVALVYAVAFGAPAAFLCYLTLLSRQSSQPVGIIGPAIEWYPPGRIVGWAAVIAGCVAALLILLLGFDSETLREAVRELLRSDTVREMDPEGTLVTPENIEPLSLALTLLLPAAFSTMWMAIVLFDLWLGGLIVQASGRALRPWPDLVALELPNFVFFGLVASLVLSFFPGAPGLVGTGFTGAFLAAFALQGLAVVHAATKGMSMRGLLLGAIYLGILLLGWVAILIAILGLAEPMLNLRGRAAGRAND